MHGAPHEARLVVRLHGGGGHHADSRHAGEGQGAHTVRRHQGGVPVAVQPGARPAELQVSSADTREKRWGFILRFLL